MVKMGMDLIKLFRTKDWWRFLIPNYLGILFVSFYFYHISFPNSIEYISLFIIVIIFTASFGYLLNEITDLSDDLRAGKKNRTIYLSAITKIIYLLIPLLGAFIPWLFLPLEAINFGLFLVQILLLLAYSVKPFRLKRYAIPGVITDALYSSVVMALVILTTFIKNSEIESEKDIFLGIFIFIALFLKGLRGILLHQLADRKNDRRANIGTFVTCYGSAFTNNIISIIILPVEILALTALTILLSKNIPGFGWLYLGFLCFIALKYSLWNFRWIPAKNYLFYFRFTFNDFYEGWIPLYALILLAFWDLSFVFILIPYVLLFPVILIKFYKDVPEIIVSFINDFKRKFYPNKIK